MGVVKKLTWKDFEQNCRKIQEATPVDVAEDLHTKLARIERAKKDYAFFFEYYFPMYATSKTAWFHTYSANLLMNNSMIRLINEWFRGCAKSVHAELGWALWLKINGKLKCMVVVGENKDKAGELLADLQAQLQTNQRIINDFGEQFSHGSWEHGKFSTRDGAAFNSIGIGQSPRGLRKAGNRPDYIVVDDVDSEELSHNPKRVRKLVDWVCDALMGCFDVGDQRFVVCNNRPFVNSVLGALVQEKLTGSEKKSIRRIAPDCKAYGAFAYQVKGFWHHMRINAVDENFNPSWSEKYTKEYWLGVRDDRSHRSWMREYMNTPIVDGGVFKNDWIRLKKPLPLEDYDALIVYIDPSWKATATSDHKAVVFLGKKGTEYHILKAFNRQCSVATMVKYAYDLYESLRHDSKRKPYHFKYKKELIIDWWIEANANQDLHLDDFQTEGEQRGYQLPIRADFRTKPDKYSRIESLSPLYERGFVFHNEDEKEDPDMLRAIEHTLAFEQGSKSPDDFNDAVEGGRYYLDRTARTANFIPITGAITHKNRY
jgi:hypothetical protein